MKHVTEWGLGLCVRAYDAREWDMRNASDTLSEKLAALGLRADTVACDGSTAQFLANASDDNCIATVATPNAVPTCPLCAVLRDAALEGKLPVRP